MSPYPDLRELPAVHQQGWPWSEASPPPPPDGQWPRITIVIPSFNQGRFLEETIRSVLLQAYPDLELIVIDGGSRDSSVDVLRRYRPWLAFWTSELDGGQSDAINKGFARATGEVITFLASDDVYEPGTLHDVARQLREHPGGEDRSLRRRVLWRERRARGCLKLANSGVRGRVAAGALLRALRYCPSLAARRHFYASWLALCGLLPRARRLRKALDHDGGTALDLVAHDASLLGSNG